MSSFSACVGARPLSPLEVCMSQCVHQEGSPRTMRDTAVNPQNQNRILSAVEVKKLVQISSKFNV